MSFPLEKRFSGKEAEVLESVRRYGVEITMATYKLCINCGYIGYLRDVALQWNWYDRRWEPQ